MASFLDELESYPSSRFSRAKSQSQSIVASAVRTGAMFIGAAGTTWGTRALGDSDRGFAIGGVVPMSLAVSTVLHLAGWAGIGGDFDPILHALGDGALAAYGAGVGAVLAQGGTMQDVLLGTGATPEQKYGDVLRFQDHHRRRR